MESKYKLVYTKDYVSDVIHAASYISEHLQNPEAADSLVKSLESAILKRAESPTGYEPFFSVVPSLQKPFYRIYVKGFVIYYTLQDGEMMIRRLLHGKQNRSEF